MTGHRPTSNHGTLLQDNRRLPADKCGGARSHLFEHNGSLSWIEQARYCQGGLARIGDVHDGTQLALYTAGGPAIEGRESQGCVQGGGGGTSDEDVHARVHGRPIGCALGGGELA